MDFLFLEFYIAKKYDQKVEDYFDIGKQSVSLWRTNKNIPSQRLLEFYQREGSMDLKELFTKLYNIK